VWVKLVCWLGVSAFAGRAYRRRERARLFGLLTVLLAVLAVAMAYTKPF